MASPPAVAGATNVTAFSGAATALKAEPEAKLSPTEKLEAQTAADTRTHAKHAASEKRAEARAKGYEGEACGEWRQFHLGEERHVHEMRHLREHHRMQLMFKLAGAMAVHP